MLKSTILIKNKSIEISCFGFKEKALELINHLVYLNIKLYTVYCIFICKQPWSLLIENELVDMEEI